MKKMNQLCYFIFCNTLKSLLLLGQNDPQCLSLKTEEALSVSLTRGQLDG